MGSFPVKVSFVRPFPRSSKMVTSYAPSIASCSIPNCAGSTLFPFESEKYMEETIFSWGTISWYSTAFQHSCPSGVFMQRRDFPPTRRSILQTGPVNPFGPHHCITYFGSVHAFQTNSRGASKTRVTTIRSISLTVLFVISPLRFCHLSSQPSSFDFVFFIRSRFSSLDLLFFIRSCLLHLISAFFICFTTTSSLSKLSSQNRR